MEHGELDGLKFEAGQKAQECVVFLRMYNDMLEKEDVTFWLEGRVQRVLHVERVFTLVESLDRVVEGEGSVA